jgi:hypothetical protein
MKTITPTDAARVATATSRPVSRPTIAIPAELAGQLMAFRRRVRWIKITEAVCIAVGGIALAFVAIFLLDRLLETPRWGRLALVAAAAAACVAIPAAVLRWGWRQRSFDRVARLIGRRFPSMGDELLGVVEIVRGQAAAGQSPSRVLCEAAVAQVAERARGFDFRQATPPARPGVWAVLAAVPVALALAAAALVPDAAGNAWSRLLAPWRTIDRFTFARLEPLPERMVVPHGEPATLAVRFSDDTRWRPARATLQGGGQQPITARATSEGYSFSLPPQIAETTLMLAAGDVRERIRIEPLHRPELAAVEAEVTLPAYLERPEPDGGRPPRQDIRGGTVAPVEGSTVRIVATANRGLAAAMVDGAPVETEGAEIRTSPRTATEESRMTLTWRDTNGLDGAAALDLVIAPRADEPPGVAMLDVPQTRGILLDTDTLTFTVAARDDFGIRRVGVEWQGLSDSATAATDAASVDRGDRLLQAGGGTVESLDAAATFCPEALGIEPQPIALRAFAEDYLPGRGRVYSSPLLLYVLDRGEHALLLNTRLQQFRQQANEVRDREMGLLATNKELRGLPAEQLLEPASRGRLEAQAAAEEANARRLERLVGEGSELVREAVKNPEFEAATLEQLAEDIQTLADIAENRMPSVAELLAQAASARTAALPAGEGPEQPPVPQVVDRESSQQPAGDEPAGDRSESAGGPGRLGLPSTQAGVAPPQGQQSGGEPAAAEPLDEAIAAQEALLAEFATVADELAAVMARLEGSTFVKRLKLASREQGSIGSRIAGLSAEAFGMAGRQPATVRKALGDVREQTVRETDKMSALMDDLQAYFDRRQLPGFRTVLEEMKELDTLGSLRQLSEDIPKEAGMSIAQAEFWSDTFDRLADDLVPPPQSGGGGQGGGRPRESLPPEVVLETMKILEDEVNLREETRVAQQARAALPPDEVSRRAEGLADRQAALADRVVAIADRLLDEPGGGSSFVQEIQLFEKVEEVMAEATDLLATTDTGPKAIAAESEAIELLLAAQAACSNSGSGGGGAGGGAGGATPGSGGTGGASGSALALLGSGNRTQRAAGGEKDQATGSSGRVLPEEFRAGLDAYFNRFEKDRR